MNLTIAGTEEELAEYAKDLSGFMEIRKSANRVAASIEQKAEALELPDEAYQQQPAAVDNTVQQVAPAPAPAPVPVVPVAENPGITLDKLTAECARLVDQGVDVPALLEKYNAYPLSTITAEALPAFVIEIRALGADV